MFGLCELFRFSCQRRLIRLVGNHKKSRKEIKKKTPYTVRHATKSPKVQHAKTRYYLCNAVIHDYAISWYTITSLKYDNVADREGGGVNEQLRAISEHCALLICLGRFFERTKLKLLCIVISRSDSGHDQHSNQDRRAFDP